MTLTANKTHMRYYIVLTILVVLGFGYLFVKIDNRLDTLQDESVGGISNVGIQTGIMREMIAINDGLTTSTSSPINIAGAKRVTLFFERSGHSSGSSDFYVVVGHTATSSTATDYVRYSKLVDNVTNANSEELTRVSNVAMTANALRTYSMDLTTDAYSVMKCVASSTTDGTSTCRVNIQW